MPEQITVKRDVLRQFGALCPPETIFTTNSSYFPPSVLATFSGRPDRFAALHFHSPVWFANVVDIMPHRQTSPATIERITAFAHQIGQTAIVARKEHPGYVFNTMLWQFLSAAMQLAGGEVASVEDIDRAWMGVMKTPIGPFGILDLIGLDTVQHIVEAWPGALKDPRAKEFVNHVHALVEAGHLGEKSGQGFYHHPQPSYREPGFLVPTLAQREARARRLAGRIPTRHFRPGSRRRRGQPVERRCDTGESGGAVHAAHGPAPINPRLTHRPNFRGAAWILGENLAARALAARLSADGATVRFVPQASGVAGAQRWIADQWQNEPAAHLFLVNAWDEPDSAAAAPMPADLARQAEDPYADSLDRRLLLPYAVCQQWFSLASKTSLLDQATLVAATALGGDFGIAGDFVRADGGALAGLLKAVFMEGAALKRLGPQVKVVDFAPAAPHEAVAESLCQEMALAQAEC